jgi:hypothetical protein
LFKVYAPEDDSGYFGDLVVASGRPVVSSAIAMTEMLCALCRKEYAGELKRGGALATYQKFVGGCRAGRIVLVPYGEQVFTAAEEIVRLSFRRAQPVMVRSLDAIVGQLGKLRAGCLPAQGGGLPTCRRYPDFQSAPHATQPAGGTS